MTSVTKRISRHLQARLSFFTALVFAVTGCATRHCSTAAQRDKRSDVPYEKLDLQGSEVLVVSSTNRTEKAPAPVLLLHEITGISPATLDFAGRLSTNGFTVYLPRLFGAVNRPGRWPELLNYARVGFWDPRWRFWVGGKTSTPYDRVFRMVDDMAEKHPGKKVGAIGMCLTGSWPIALMANTNVEIGVVCHPAVPWPSNRQARKCNLGMDEADLADGFERIRQELLTVIGVRFAKDSISPDERLQRIERAITPRGRFIDGRITQSEYGSDIDAKAHSVFTGFYLSEMGEPHSATHAQFTNLVTNLKQILQ